VHRGFGPWRRTVAAGRGSSRCGRQELLEFGQVGFWNIQPELDHEGGDARRPGTVSTVSYSFIKLSHTVGAAVTTRYFRQHPAQRSELHDHRVIEEP
jgi:hypothetical protein